MAVQMRSIRRGMGSKGVSKIVEEVFRDEFAKELAYLATEQTKSPPPTTE